MKHILITGVPGIGKTTLVKNIIKNLGDLQVEVDGFITEEMRNQRSQRTGFGIRLIKSQTSAVLADKSMGDRSSGQNVRSLGQYTVYVKNFEDLVLQPMLSIDEGILVIDEIGKMELFSKRFEEAISIVFSKKQLRILATIPVNGPAFVEKLKRTSDCQLFTVTTENRDKLVKEITTILLNKPCS